MNFLGLQFKRCYTRDNIDYFDWNPIFQFFNSFPYLGIDLGALNLLCSKLKAPFYYEDPKTIHCAHQHFKTWFQSNTNIRFSPLDGNHRSWILCRKFEGFDERDVIPLLPHKSKKIPIHPNSYMMKKISYGIVYPLGNILDKKCAETLRAQSATEQYQRTCTIETSIISDWKIIENSLAANQDPLMNLTQV